MSQPTHCGRCDKDTYRSYEAAARAALLIKVGPTTSLVAYPCPGDPDLWHLSSHPTARSLRRTA